MPRFELSNDTFDWNWSHLKNQLRVLIEKTYGNGRREFFSFKMIKMVKVRLGVFEPLRDLMWQPGYKLCFRDCKYIVYIWRSSLKEETNIVEVTSNTTREILKKLSWRREVSKIGDFTYKFIFNLHFILNFCVKRWRWVNERVLKLRNNKMKNSFGKNLQIRTHWANE